MKASSVWRSITVSRARYVLIPAVVVALIMMYGLSAFAVAPNPEYTEQWDGRGTDSQDCSKVGDGPRTEAGWIHWVFSTKGSSTSAELILGGTGSGTYSPGPPAEAEIWHFYTPFFPLEGLTATINLYGGGEGPGGGLVISDFCPGVNGNGNGNGNGTEEPPIENGNGNGNGEENGNGTEEPPIENGNGTEAPPIENGNGEDPESDPFLPFTEDDPVTKAEEEPFLPYTGGGLGMLLGAAAAAGAGSLLRRLGS